MSPKSSTGTRKSAAPSPKGGGARAPKSAASSRPSSEIRRVADLLKQVSDPTRLQVLMLLGEKERNVSELCADLGTQSQPAVSHHLALLRHGRLIEPRRSGKHNFYGLTDAGRELAKVVSSVVG
jgi:DNA-binding transcriptional ArsR family regulator